MVKRLTIALALLALACQRNEVSEAFPDPAEALRGKWINEIGAARDGDAAALAKLDEVFRTSKDPDEKEVIASELVDSANPAYREHIRALVRAQFAENPPFPWQVWFGSMRDSFSGEFKEWCERKHMTLAEGVHRSMITYTLRVMHLRKGDEALLLEGLKQRNHEVAASCAMMLAEVEAAEAIPAMTAAAKRAPQPMAFEITEAIASFDTPAAWAAVKSLGLPDEELFTLRQKIASESERR